MVISIAASSAKAGLWIKAAPAPNMSNSSIAGRRRLVGTYGLATP